MQDVLFSVNENKIKHCYKATLHDQFSFYAKVITEWNSLPTEVIDQSSVLSLSFLIFFYFLFFFSYICGDGLIPLQITMYI